MSEQDILQSILRCYRGRPPEGCTHPLELYQQLDNLETDHFGEPLLFYAAIHGDVDSVAWLLEAGADAGMRSERGYTALHRLAYEAGRNNLEQEQVREVTRLLLEAGTSPLRKDPDGRTCTYIAAEKGLWGMIQALVEQGKKLDLADSTGNTPLHGAVSYAKHSASSFFQYTKPEYEAFQAKPIPDNDMERRIHSNRLQTIQHQYDRDKGEVDAYFHTVQLLLEGGLDPDQKNNYGHTAKEEAFECMDVRIAALLNGSYAEEGDEAGQLQMRTKGMNAHQAVLGKDHDALAAILELGADPDEFYGEQGAVDGIQMEGKSPLALACQVLDDASVELLIAHKADPNLKDAQGRIPLAHAFGVDATVRTSNNTFKNKVLDKILAAMCQAGLNLDTPADDGGNTLLNLAAGRLGSGGSYNGQSLPGRLLELLLKAGADVNTANYGGVTPLMLVCAGRGQGTEDFQLTLLEEGADVAARDKQGDTPLIYVCRNSKHAMAKEMADMLFQFGDPDPGAVNNEGKTALEYATEQNNELLVNYLLLKQ